MAFTFAHLSDPHLAPMPVPNIAHIRLKQFAGYVNWLRSRQFIHRADVLAKIVRDMASQKPSHIVASGDIANISLPFEFVRGRDWLGTLGSSNEVSVVPGNHDIYVAGAEVLAQENWGAYMRGDSSESFPFVRRRGPLALIGLCSGVPTELFYASGRLGAEQLARFATLLDELKTDGAFRVVIIHHPPVSKSSWRKRLVDAEQLMHVIATHGAELLIHGHDHLHMLNWLPGPTATRVPAVGVPSASAAPGTRKDAAAYNVYRVGGQAGAWRCEMISRGIGPAGDVVEQKRMELVDQL